MTIYLDSSAIVKLIAAERESDALRAFLGNDAVPKVTSALARTEVVRAVASVGDAAVSQARMVLTGLTEIAVTRTVLDRAAELLPESPLRTLDAVHLASALLVGAHLSSLVTYDRRMQAAAASIGVPIE